MTEIRGGLRDLWSRIVVNPIRRRSITVSEVPANNLPLIDSTEYEVAFSVLKRIGYGTKEDLRRTLFPAGNDQIAKTESYDSRETGGDIRGWDDYADYVHVTLRSVDYLSKPCFSVLRNLGSKSRRILADVGRFSKESGNQDIQARLTLISGRLPDEVRRVFLLLTSNGVSIHHATEGDEGRAELHEHTEGLNAVWNRIPSQSGIERAGRLLEADWKITPQELNGKIDVMGTVKSLMELPSSQQLDTGMLKFT